MPTFLLEDTHHFPLFSLLNETKISVVRFAQILLESVNLFDMNLNFSFQLIDIHTHPETHRNTVKKMFWLNCELELHNEESHKESKKEVLITEIKYETGFYSLIINNNRETCNLK